MKQHAEKNGRTNLFRSYTVAELERFARSQYCQLTIERAVPGSYWLFAECLDQFQKQKGIAQGEWPHYLTRILKFAYMYVNDAMVIWDRHENMESLEGKTMREALGLRGVDEASGNCNGQSQPSRAARPYKDVSPAGGNGQAKPDDGRYAGQQTVIPEGGAKPAKVPTLMSSVPAERTEWLWTGYIPLGELTIVEGHPGTNKSLLTYDLASRLSTGREMPCVTATTGQSRNGGALFLVGEDSISKTVRSRLVAAGADLARIAVLDDVAIPDDRHAIKKAVREVGAKLVVVDTVNDFLACNVQGNQQVRRALRPLRELAEEANVAVVLLRHFVKAAGCHSLLRGGGSVGITAMARSQLKLYRHPDDQNLRLLVQDKSNLGPLSRSLLFEVTPVENDSARLHWHGQCALTIEDLERKQKGSPTLERAEEFLLDMLANGRQEASRLVEQARGMCSKRTLDEAKRNLSIVTMREGKGPQHKVYWCLPAPVHAPVRSGLSD